MKDDKFWKIIEEQNPERKEENWKKLNIVLQSEENENNVIPVKTRRIRWSYKRIASVCASAVLLLGICTSVGVYIKKQNDGEAGKSRFCTQDQYGLSISEMNLKEYASFIDKELLYFDWYDNYEYLAGLYVCVAGYRRNARFSGRNATCGDIGFYYLICY